MPKAFFITGGLCDDSLCHSVLRLARELRRRGAQVGLACGGGVFAAEFAKATITPFVAPALAGGRCPLFLPKPLLEHIRGFGPDILHLFGRHLARWGARLSAALGLPYVLTVTGFAPHGHRGKLPGDWRRGAVMAVSEELREELVNQARVRKDAIAVIPFGIALEDYARYQAPHARPASPVVGMVGPLVPERGCEYFVRAAREVLDRGFAAHFLIAGDGPERRRIRRLIRDLGVASALTVVESFHDYRRMIAVLDVCVIPAVREGLGLDVVEAMACRRPVVATGAGPAFTLISDGETGLLAPKKDPVALAEKIIRLLGDPELARRLVDAAYARVRERYSLEASATQLLALYDKCTAKPEAA